MSTPVWWSEVLAATFRRRVAAGDLLDHAVPTVDDGVLRLAFARPDIAAAWEESGAQAALEGALVHCGRAMPVEVVSLTT
ncbi:hypothetical protein [Streptomyces violaceus]|uniref:DnaA N-terminal domain-containing protein n=1 Tax=Streptomyces violaceus TaxID=1936 RepID=A0ABZ1NKV3_STRVL